MAPAYSWARVLTILWSDDPLVLQPIGHATHWSYVSLVICPTGPMFPWSYCLEICCHTSHWSYDSLILQLIGPTTHWSYVSSVLHIGSQILYGPLVLRPISPKINWGQDVSSRSFDVFFDLCLNKRLSKDSWGWWLETPSCHASPRLQSVGSMGCRTNGPYQWTVGLLGRSTNGL